MPDQNALFTAAEVYDRCLAPALFQPYAEALIHRIKGDIAGPVLETACGTGVLTRLLRTCLPLGIALVATDLSEGMLRYAQAKIPAPDIEWRQADAGALPFQDEFFSTVVCQFGLMFVPDRGAAFSEARRVLREQGTFVFTVWDSLEYNPQARVINETIRSFFPGNPTAYGEAPYAFHDRSILRNLLETNGFEDVAIEEVAITIRSPTAALLAQGVVEGTPLAAATLTHGADPARILDAIAARLRDFGGDEPFESDTRAVFARARAAAP